MRLPSLTLAALAVTFSLCAQAPAALDDPLAEFEEANLLFDRDAYALAHERQGAMAAYEPLPGLAPLDEARQRARLREALAAQRAGLPEATVLLESFVDRYSPQPIATQAILQVADVAFAERDYARAASYYERLPLAGLSREQRDDVRFRLGYAAFTEKDFAKAGRYLGDLRSAEGAYQEPAAYYYALTRFYQGDNPGARAAFELLRNSERYAQVVPGNLAQIYFADGEYERLIGYGAPLADGLAARERQRMHLMVGRSYFELGRFAEALPHLEASAADGARLSAADFYQLGYAQYRTGNFAPAVENLGQLAGEDSPLGQAALYYLGLAELELGRRERARPAFARAARMDFDPEVRAEAAWNVAKLNYELGYEQEALEALQSIPADSRHFRASRALLSEVLLTTRDYARALAILDELGELSPALRETRQRVRVLRGLELLRARETDDAESLLRLSLEEASDAYYKALATYWLGDIAYRRGEMDGAARRLTSFLTTARALPTALPDEANPATANYLLGYTRLKQEDYGVALTHFQEAVAALERRLRLGGASNRTLTRMLGDATLRAGDASFKRNDYDGAARFYESAVTKRYAGYDYAQFQLAMIEGLRGDATDKILALETVIEEFPGSEFADDAQLELGQTYLNINQLNQATKALQGLVARSPRSELHNEGLLLLGLVSINLGNTETAIGYYKQVFANEPRASEVRRAQDALEEIYIDDLGRPDDYFDFLATVPGFELDATVRDSISYAAAETRYQTGDHERAVEQYSRYLREFPRGAYATEALYRRADSYLILERYGEALADFEAIVRLGEGRYYDEALAKAGRLAYDGENDFARAYRYYARLLEREATATPENRLMALRAAYRSGNREAVYALAEPVIMDAELSEADKAVAGFYLGKVAYDEKDYDRALASFNAVIRNDDGEAAAEARYLVARIYYVRKEVELAEAIARAAQKQSAGYPEWQARSALLLADVYVDQGDYLSARAVAEGLVANYRGDEVLEAAARDKLAEVNRLQAASSAVLPVDTSVILLEGEEPPPGGRDD